MAQQPKDALNRIAASKPPRNPNTNREVLRTKIDSGVCGPVIDPEAAVDYRLQETEANKNGVKKLSVSLMSMRNQVCPCTGPLTSVAKFIDSDNFVGFSSLGSFVLNLRTNEVDWLTRKDDQFELELEIVPFAEAKKHLESIKSGGPGRRWSV